MTQTIDGIEALRAAMTGSAVKPNDFGVVTELEFQLHDVDPVRAR